MEWVELRVRVPREYLEDAEDFGMLDDETVARVLRDELDQRIMQFVDSEVKAYRAEQRAKHSTDGG